jgi:hypothetical protein
VNYQKPKIAVVTAATAVIQGAGKGPNFPVDNPDYLPTASAYEADE